MTSSRTLTWFIMVAGLAGLGLLMSATGAARPLQSVAQRAGEPLIAVTHSVTTPITEFFADLGRAGRLRDENRALMAENERLRSALAGAREGELREADLAALMALTNLPGGQLTVAGVIARDPSPVRDVIQINRGRRDGVEDGMSVAGKGGALIGTVEKSFDSVAWVRLITDPKSAANAIVQESRATATAVGAAGHVVRMEFVTQGAEVKPGDTVLTSGLGGSYPAGLLIGRVAKVEGGPLDVFKDVQVEPASRLSSLESVVVLTGFRPQPVEGIGR